MTVSKFVQCCTSIFDHEQRSEIKKEVTMIERTSIMTVSKFVQCCTSIFDHEQRSEIKKEVIDSTRKSIHAHEKRVILESRSEVLKI